MSKDKQGEATDKLPEEFFLRPEVGTVFTILSGLAFLFVCMILPLVGKAGVATVHIRQNTIAFSAAVLVCLVLAALASWSKLKRRALDQSPLPLFSLGLCVVSILLLIALYGGLLRI